MLAFTARRDYFYYEIRRASDMPPRGNFLALLRPAEQTNPKLSATVWRPVLRRSHRARRFISCQASSASYASRGSLTAASLYHAGWCVQAHFSETVPRVIE